MKSQQSFFILEYHIEKQIESGTTIFYTQMARGVDLWVAEIVLQKRKAKMLINAAINI